MQINIVREKSSNKSTIGTLSINGKLECVTLEDVVRTGEKVFGKTAIPAGTYGVILTESARFKRVLPLVLNVPGFSGIRIHPGNTDADTEGCILVGTVRGNDMIYNSRTAFDALFKKLQAADHITLTIG